jgi:hypothetical protein
VPLTQGRTLVLTLITAARVATKTDLAFAEETDAAPPMIATPASRVGAEGHPRAREDLALVSPDLRNSLSDRAEAG